MVLGEIKALYVSPGDPSFRIFFKDGRDVWIRIGPERLDVLQYQKTGYRSGERILFLPKIPEPVS